MKNNNLFHVYNDGFEDVVKEFPVSVPCLDVSDNELDLFKYGILHNVIQSIPGHVSALNLGNTAFSQNVGLDIYHSIAKKLAATLAIIPEHVFSLDFSSNKLASYAAEDLLEIVKSIPTTELNLSNNDLYAITSDQIFFKEGFGLTYLLQSIHPNVNSLNISNNNLAELSIKAIRNAFKNISKNIYSLDLSFNNFDEIDFTILLGILACLPRSVKYVSLKGNNLFDKIPFNEKDEVLKQLRAWCVKRPECHFDFDGNGESDLGRAALPLISLMKEKPDLPKQVVDQIGFFMNLKKPLSDRLNIINKCILNSR